MLACAEEVLRQLDLHYPRVTLCAATWALRRQKTIDIEVWMPGQGEGGRLPRNLELFGVRRFPGPAHGRPLSRPDASRVSCTR